MRHYYTLDGKFFSTKKSVEDAVKALLQAHPLNREFESALLSDLVVNHHYYCSKHKLRPSKFRKITRLRGGYELQGWFETIGWHGVSYLKCLTPPTFESEVQKALRAVVEPVVWARSTGTCVRCGSMSNLEQNHVKPTFKEIFQACLKVVTEQDRMAWNEFNWVAHSEFRLPEGSPATALALEMHKTAVIETLCSTCHRGVKRKCPPGASTFFDAWMKASTQASQPTPPVASDNTKQDEPRSTRGPGVQLSLFTSIPA